MASYPIRGGYIALHANPSFPLRTPADAGDNVVHNYAYVIDCVTMLFQQCIPQLRNTTLTIRNDPYAPNPRYDRLERHITLHTTPVRWSQITYQYAHELCHHAIPADVPAELRWFEESLCEMASYYFLRKLGYLWEARNEPLYNADTGNPFAPELVSYAVDEALKAQVFDLKDPQIQWYLASNCYDRAKNAYLANQLLPIFQEYPQTWLAVPYLCRVRGTSIKTAIEEWMCLSPKAAQTGLRWIYNLF